MDFRVSIRQAEPLRVEHPRSVSLGQHARELPPSGQARPAGLPEFHHQRDKNVKNIATLAFAEVWAARQRCPAISLQSRYDRESSVAGFGRFWPVLCSTVSTIGGACRGHLLAGASQGTQTNVFTI
jgi:hypothetical protein